MKMPSTKRNTRERTTALTSAKAAAKKRLVEQFSDEYNKKVDEEMLKYGFRRQEQVIVDWSKVPANGNGTQHNV
jgi:arginyl-tRNA--protein-N-Asp/Glu arginylyltransferase